MIFMDLCDGSLKDLLPSHSSLSSISGKGSLVARRLHLRCALWLGPHPQQGASYTMTRKSDNILYTKSPRSRPHTFRISDFGNTANGSPPGE